MFTPQRLTLARKRRGLKKGELAEKAKLTIRSISAYEGGEFPPAEETIDDLARILSFPRQFLRAPAIDEILPDGASFRALSSMTAAQRDRVLAAGTIALDVGRWIAERFRLPVCGLPDLRWDDAENAARALREDWKLGERPIKNMVHLLEFYGVRVFSLDDEVATVDAFSLWRDEIPFVFLNPLKSGERGRFDAAHELGHLILHRHGAPTGREAEIEADKFASAFLMPRGSVIAHAPRFSTVSRLVERKALWGVSVGALARRLHDLRLMTEWQYRQTCIEISSRGWRTSEPNGLERETSQVLPKVMQTLRDDGLSLDGIADQTYVSAQEIRAMCFGHGLLGVRGGGQRSPRAATTLSLVK